MLLNFSKTLSPSLNEAGRPANAQPDDVFTGRFI